MPDYTAKVDALLEHVVDFTDEDFADLALAACDQAGLDALVQRRIARILGIKTFGERESERIALAMRADGVRP